MHQIINEINSKERFCNQAGLLPGINITTGIIRIAFAGLSQSSLGITVYCLQNGPTPEERLLRLCAVDLIVHGFVNIIKGLGEVFSGLLFVHSIPMLFSVSQEDQKEGVLLMKLSILLLWFLHRIELLWKEKWTEIRDANLHEQTEPLLHLRFVEELEVLPA